MALINCPECNGKVSDTAPSCPHCGYLLHQKTATSVDSLPYADERSSADDHRRYTQAITVGVAVLVTALIIGSFLLFVNRKPSFQKLYDTYCSSIFADLASDGSYLSIDTNPYDLSSPPQDTQSDAISAIENVNSALGFPESLLNEMGKTSALDGVRTETSGKVTVTWKFHPDKGLEVTYKR